MNHNRVTKIKSLETDVDLSALGFNGKVVSYCLTVNISDGYDEFGQPKFRQIDCLAMCDFKLRKLENEK